MFIKFVTSTIDYNINTARSQWGLSELYIRSHYSEYMHRQLLVVHTPDKGGSFTGTQGMMWWLKVYIVDLQLPASDSFLVMFTARLLLFTSCTDKQASSIRYYNPVLLISYIESSTNSQYYLSVTNIHLWRPHVSPQGFPSQWMTYPLQKKINNYNPSFDKYYEAKIYTVTQDQFTKPCNVCVDSRMYR